ncbi:MAG: FAD-dependent oxidoreductase [Aestuariivita sp.]|nr:FAD-dependent oxidoreductase [Aestuariivita sp.]
MTEILTTARAVIIGGGAVGVSALYHLAKAGWTDCVLLERNDLTAGSTWHAAGNVPTFSTSWSIMNMQRYSTELYRGLGDAVDYPINYHVTGSIRLAHSRERMQEFHRVCGMGRYQGIDIQILSLDETRSMYPFMETHDLAGVLYDPTDGDIDPAQLTQALAKGARDMGAWILRFTPATGISRKNGEWIVHTGRGDIRCEYVVNAAGYYAQRVSEWFVPYGGRTVPMVVMSHQYLLTEDIPEIAAWTRESGHRLPLVRDVDVSYYLRQEKNGFNLGPYERDCRAHWITPDDPMPEDFSFQVYPDDLDRLETYIEDAMVRVPQLGRSGIAKVINGPIPYTPDGNPLIGPMPGVSNAFEACVFTFGIAQAGGAGKVLAEWMMDGQTEWDMWSCDPRRYTDYTDREYCIEKGREVYGHEYAMHFPWQEWPAGRDRKQSALHDRLKQAGAVFGVYNGWERANYFACPDDDTSYDSTQTWNRSGPWEQRIRAECEAVRDHCGVLAITGFSRFKVQGPGARAYVDRLTASRLPSAGRMSLAYFADNRGRIVTEMSVFVHNENEVILITAAFAEWHDYELLSRNAPEGVNVTNHTKEFECLLVTGPSSREILDSLNDGHNLDAGWLSLSPDGRVSGKACVLARVSFAGELGWEIHCRIEDSPDIWDAVTTAGAKPVGMWALNALRMEKGYRAWKCDLSSDYSLLESGLDRFISFDKNMDFPGKAALLEQKRSGVAKRFVTLIVNAGDADAPYMATLWHDNQVVGETTSGGWGYRVNASVALGMLRSDLAVPGTEIEVDIYGERCKATVQPDAPLWDPGNERLRA